MLYWEKCRGEKCRGEKCYRGEKSLGRNIMEPNKAICSLNYMKKPSGQLNKSLTVTINDVFGSILLAINPQLTINDTKIVLCDQRME